jgi:hypothetical protein
MLRSGSKKFSLVGFTAIWVLAVGFGLLKLQNYSTAPSPAAAPPENWPGSSALVKDHNRLTVVMLAHPQCPCTRASLGELAIAAAQAAGRLDIHIVFLESPAFELESDLWRSARAIPGANVIADPDGVEIRKFGVNASGHTLAYDAAGRLVFSGGVVSARGHAGANRGREAIVELAHHGRSSVTTAPVFGCALQSREPLAAAK